MRSAGFIGLFVHFSAHGRCWWMSNKKTGKKGKKGGKGGEEEEERREEKGIRYSFFNYVVKLMPELVVRQI